MPDSRPAPPTPPTALDLAAEVDLVLDSVGSRLLMERDNPKAWEELHAARSALARLASQGWRSIDTAPKDGTEVLLYASGLVTYGGWVTDMDFGAEREGQLGCAGWWMVAGDSPTHWMPLPSPPEGLCPRAGSD